MSKPEIESVYKSTSCGEGPHWDSKKQELIYSDIEEKSIHIYSPTTGENSKLELDGKVSFVIPVESDPNQFIVGIERDLKLLEWDRKSTKHRFIQTLYSVDEESPNNRFNDGKCDNAGRLWAGTMGYQNTSGVIKMETFGNLFRLDLNGSLSTQQDNVGISNGLAWSSDNSIFYYVDTSTYRVDAFDYDIQLGNIANRRTIFDFAENNIDGVPDGMTIDANGNLWLAVFYGSQILHIDPCNGKLISTLQMPTKNITSLAFGGPNLDELYATSASKYLTNAELAAQPEAGSLFRITNIGTKGVSAGVPFKGNLSK